MGLLARFATLTLLLTVLGLRLPVVTGDGTVGVNAVVAGTGWRLVDANWGLGA